MQISVLHFSIYCTDLGEVREGNHQRDRTSIL